MITELRALWQEAFGDTDAFLDGFFRTGYDPRRSMVHTIDGQLAAALYWFDARCEGQKVAYIYAVATAKAYRGRGICKALMQRTHARLRQEGYAAAALMPVDTRVAALYASLGYRPFGAMESCKAAPLGNIPLRELSAPAYHSRRKAFLDASALDFDLTTIEFLGTYARFFETDNALFAVAEEKGVGYFQEFFGSEGELPRILGTLGYSAGHYRRPGEAAVAPMYLPLTENAPAPTYLGLPLD